MYWGYWLVTINVANLDKKRIRRANVFKDRTHGSGRLVSFRYYKEAIRSNESYWDQWKHCTEHSFSILSISLSQYIDVNHTCICIGMILSVSLSFNSVRHTCILGMFHFVHHTSWYSIRMIYSWRVYMYMYTYRYDTSPSLSLKSWRNNRFSECICEAIFALFTPAFQCSNL